MKKLFVLLLFFMPMVSQAQDYDFITPLHKSNAEKARTIADLIAGNARTKYVFNKVLTDPKTQQASFLYYPENVTEAQIKSKKATKLLRVDFWAKENPESPGEVVFRFKEATGSYMDLFPTWQRYFNMMADENNLPFDYNGKGLVDFTKKIEFRFQKADFSSEWKLTNRSTLP
ncbi:hypothetical protein [Flavobacterium kingsejongi]|uniref:Uncharacterized protein n=1 Tax=Flavobacterium kingsejongi TaxID=1678728 RepID=A0A2S1LRK5_9FLAO|nr:hypothetical protein [Flavobacterium kingsejongi]AWG26291.1 hypothetical protein FK004_14150 [Flavobacterium kingsejongi]